LKAPEVEVDELPEITPDGPVQEHQPDGVEEKEISVESSESKPADGQEKVVEKPEITEEPRKGSYDADDQAPQITLDF